MVGFWFLIGLILAMLFVAVIMGTWKDKIAAMERKYKQLCAHAESEHQRYLSGDPLAIYGQYLPDPMFRPEVPPEPIGRSTLMTDEEYERYLAAIAEQQVERGWIGTSQIVLSNDQSKWW